MKVLVLGKYDYQTYPIVECMIEVSPRILEKIGESLKFDVDSSIVPMTEDDKKELNG